MVNDKLTQAGFSSRVGGGGLQSLTLARDTAANHAPAEIGTDEAYANGSPQVGLFAFIAGLALLWAARKWGKGLQKPEIMEINPYYLLTTVLTAVIGIVLLKVLFTLVPVPGVTPLVHAV